MDETHSVSEVTPVICLGAAPVFLASARHPVGRYGMGTPIAVGLFLLPAVMVLFLGP